MTLNFPTSPSVNDTYTYNGTTFVWDGEKWDASTPFLVNSSNIVDGAITASKLAADSVTAEKVDSSAVAKNLIVNGDMRVAQRGTSSTSVGLGTVDRWHSGGSGGTITQTQEDLSSADSPYTEGFRKFFRQTNTAVASATSHYRQVETKLEAQDIATSGWNYTSPTSNITVSAWIRSSVAGTYSYQLRSADGTAQSYVGTVTLDADTWTMVTQTYPGNTNLTFDNDSNLGLRVIWFPYLGTDYTTSSPTLNAWHSFDGTNMTGDDTAGWGTTAGATFDITGVQLTASAEPLPFQHEDYGTTLHKCQRYYRKLTGRTHFFPSALSGNVFLRTISGAQPFRVTPTLTFASSTNINSGPTVSGSSTPESVYLTATPTSTNSACYSVDVELDAEL